MSALKQKVSKSRGLPSARSRGSEPALPRAARREKTLTKKAVLGPELVKEAFTLRAYAKDCEADLEGIEKSIDQKKNKMWNLRVQMRPVAKARNEMQQDVDRLDRQIHLLLKDHLKKADIELDRVDESKESGGDQLFLQNKEHYEKMFYVLQKNPRYFAAVASEVPMLDMEEFTNTIIFDMYGDQFDTSEERLLLQLFKTIIKTDFERAAEENGGMGSLFRANTAVTMMLSSYARRGEGLNILKKVLETPIQDMLNQRDLTLEINAYKVYQEVIQNYERTTGKKWPEQRNISIEEAAKKDFVKQLIAPRIKMLQTITNNFTDRILRKVDEVPYGIRWICKQLAEMGEKYFPDEDRYRVGSLVGGYIFLRFFNPVIVTPERANLLGKRDQIKTKSRRNLVLVAKILQNQSNGVPFRDKIMERLNPFLKANRDRIQKYFQDLILIEPLEDRLEIDSMLQLVRRRQPTLRISYNQIFLVHRLIRANKQKWIKTPNDELAKIILPMGKAPDALPKGQNRTVVLTLVPPTMEQVSPPMPTPPYSASPLGSFPNSPPVNTSHGDLLRATDAHQHKRSIGTGRDLASNKLPVWLNLKEIITNTKYPQRILFDNDKSLKQFLADMIVWARKNGEEDLEAQIEAVSKKIEDWCNITEATDAEEAEELYNSFLQEYVRHLRYKKVLVTAAKKKLQRIQGALKDLQKHNVWLKEQKAAFKDYLKSVTSQQPKPEKDKKAKKQVEFKHNELCNKGIIINVDPSEKTAVLKKLIYVFKKVTTSHPPDFEIHVRYKTRVKTIDVQTTPLKYMELLEMQDRQENELKVESISLSVQLLLNMLRSEFNLTA